jgi:hypothetical protein
MCTPNTKNFYGGFILQGKKICSDLVYPTANLSEQVECSSKGDNVVTFQVVPLAPSPHARIRGAHFPRISRSSISFLSHKTKNSNCPFSKQVSSNTT